jgi:hypothetical protein
VVPSSTGLPSQALELGGSLLSFAFSPCLLFGALYVLGKKVRLDEDWKSAAVSLFAGGAIAGALTIFAVSVVTWSDALSEITQQFGNGWNVASWVLSIVEGGLFMIFIGLAAVYIASRRTGKTIPPVEEGTPQDDAGATLQGGSDLAGSPGCAYNPHQTLLASRRARSARSPRPPASSRAWPSRSSSVSAQPKGSRSLSQLSSRLAS